MTFYTNTEKQNAGPIKIVEIGENAGSIDVVIQDQYSEAIDFYICENKGQTSPVTETTINDTEFDVLDTTGAAIGDCINIREKDRMFQSIITEIDGNTISFKSGLDYAFTKAASVCFGEWDLSTANGSTTPVVFCIAPPPEAKYDIYGISVSMEDDSQMYEGKFGGIDALTNGLVGKIVDGYDKQLFLVTNNAGFREYGFITEYPDKVPTGTYAFWGNKSYREGNGVALRLDGATGDTINIIVNDDLTDLTKVAMGIHGHKVED